MGGGTRGQAIPRLPFLTVHCALFVHLVSFRAESSRSTALVLREGRAARKVPIVKDFLTWLEGRRKAGGPAPRKSVDNEI